MTELSPYNKRRPTGGVIEDGEHVDFDLAFFDSAPRAFITDARTQPPGQDRAIRAAVDRAQAAHDHKFAFLGDAAPKFDRELAELVEKGKASTAPSAVRDAAYAARYNPTPGVSKASAPPNYPALESNGQAVRDAAHLSRYSGE